jgi:hypothetical protein
VRLDYCQPSSKLLNISFSIPFLYEDAYQWYESFDQLGELIERPNPTPALDLLSKVHLHLTKDCSWPSNRIHLFGFAQGGSVAVEFSIKLWKEHLINSKASGTTEPSAALGSIVSISGPLLSYPTISTPCPTPVLIIHAPSSGESALPKDAIAGLKKAFNMVSEKITKNAGMPNSKEGWQPIMEFWSRYLSRRQIDGLYEVMSGTSGPPS